MSRKLSRQLILKPFCEGCKHGGTCKLSFFQSAHTIGNQCHQHRTLFGFCFHDTHAVLVDVLGGTNIGMCGR